MNAHALNLARIAHMTLRIAGVTVLGFFIFGPLASVAIWSVALQWYWPHALPQEVGLRYWVDAFSGRSSVWSALTTSLWVAVIVVACALALSVPAGYAFARFRIPLGRLLLVLFLMPKAFPQLPIFINLAEVFYRYNLAGTVPGVILVHLIASLVYAVWITTATFRSVPVELEEAAINLGDSRLKAFFRITLPLALPGIIASSIFVFLHSLDEFTGTFLVGAPYVQTLPVLMYTASMGYNMQMASVIAILLTIPAVVFMAILERFLRAEYIGRLGV